jgi:hypothetical protein
VPRLLEEAMSPEDTEEFLARAEAARIEAEKLLIESFGGDGKDDGEQP